MSEASFSIHPTMCSFKTEPRTTSARRTCFPEPYLQPFLLLRRGNLCSAQINTGASVRKVESPLMKINQDCSISFQKAANGSLSRSLCHKFHTW
ncbi:hypothetical protein CDAR_31611 [Caerostris darwini]|uniref:Uncharacterized protein n=1 Tax=Caerostris darwini TaxID=1538125 RepID=A0AAV4NQR7_9ARAC|nr:hypothetical protein CDAR_31611 [Caerostris darwini]